MVEKALARIWGLAAGSALVMTDAGGICEADTPALAESAANPRRTRQRNRPRQAASRNNRSFRKSESIDVRRSFKTVAADVRRLHIPCISRSLSLVTSAATRF